MKQANINLTGTISAKPMIKEKVIHSRLKDDAGVEHQLVLFKTTTPAEVVEVFGNAKMHDAITIAGRWDSNPMNGQARFVVNDVIKAANFSKPKDMWAIDPDTDFVVGSETPYGTISIIPAKRNDESVYYTDGEMIWAPHWPEKMPATF